MVSDLGIWNDKKEQNHGSAVIIMSTNGFRNMQENF